FFFFSTRRRHTRYWRDWSSDVCSSDLKRPVQLKGAYYEPTILVDITFDMAVWKEEVFGPVLPIVVFNTEDEAVALANDSEYGLGAYVYTQNKERALRISQHLQTGNISVNG